MRRVLRNMRGVEDWVLSELLCVLDRRAVSKVGNYLYYFFLKRKRRLEKEEKEKEKKRKRNQEEEVVVGNKSDTRGTGCHSQHKVSLEHQVSLANLATLHVKAQGAQ